MRKIYVIFLVLALTSCICGCSGADSNSSSSERQIVVLPDQEATQTVNGYKKSESDASTNMNSSSKPHESSDSEPTVSEPESSYFVGNKNTKKFHTQYCKYVSSISDKNLHSFETIEDALNDGYSPCGHCINNR